MAKQEIHQKPIGTREWYDFIGLMADGLQFIHVGGREATDFLIKGYGINTSTRVLDVGCGGGNTACLLAKEIGCHVTGIDISEVMVAQANKRAAKEDVPHLVEFRQADVFDLPFGDASFDAVLLESVLTPLPGNKLDALKEIHRVMAPGGRIGANEAVFKEEMPAEVREILNSHPAVNEPFSEKSLREIFEKAGFTIQGWKVIEQAEAPNAMKQLGCGGLITFMFKAYPKILVKMLTDKRIREAGKIDDQITKANKEYMSAALVVASKIK